MKSNTGIQRDGSSKDKAILMSGDYETLIKREYEKLSEMLGVSGVDWVRFGVGLLDDSNGFHDEFHIILSNGEQKRVFFEITEPFRQMQKANRMAERGM